MSAQSGKKPASRAPRPGLSLEALAKGKLSTYDKRHAIAKHQALQAKKINKLNKLKRKLQAQGRLAPALPEPQELDDPFGDTAAARPAPEAALKRQEAGQPPGKKKRKHRAAVDAPASPAHAEPPPPAADDSQQQPPQQPQQPQQPHAKHKRFKPPSQLQRLAAEQDVEKQRQQQEQQEAQARIQAQVQAKQAKQKHRQEQKHQHFQRTKKGQPLMRYRIEKMLDELRAGQ